MKKVDKKNLGKSSYLLTAAASLVLFVLVIFFSYSLWGAKGTFGACGVYKCFKCSTAPNYRWAYSNPNRLLCDETSTASCSSVPCPSGSTSCPSGVINNNGVCMSSECGAGMGKDSSTTTGCSRCAAGYYSPAGDNSCHKCPNSALTSNAGASSCTVPNCGAGQAANNSGSGCYTCPAGYYSPAKNNLCYKCPSGTTSPAGSSSSSACKKTGTGGACGAGMGADSSATTGCSKCAAGYYSPANDNTCHKCPSGQTSNAGASACNLGTCGAGMGADSSATTGCSRCAAGYYSPASDNSCHKCPSGQTSPAGSDSINDCTASGTACGAGMGIDVGATTGCSRCAAGYYSPANDNTCHKCPTGTTSNAGATSSSDCFKTISAGCYYCDGSSQYNNAFIWSTTIPNSQYCVKQADSVCNNNSTNGTSPTNYACFECSPGGYTYYVWNNKNYNAATCIVVNKTQDNCKANTTAAFNEPINANRCYAGSIVYVTTCQPDGTGALCNVKSGGTVLRDGLSPASNCSGGDDGGGGNDYTPTPSDDGGGGTDYTPTPSDDNGGGGSTTPTNPSAAFSDTVNGDRCYNGTWVRVMTCQPASVSGAQCKLKDGTLVLRSNITLSYGCQDISEAYTDVIDDYRCNKDSGKWIYISSCQPAKTGAKCKTSDSTILRSSVTNGNGCSSSQPGGSSGGNQGVTNPQTGTTEMIVAFAIGIIALGVSAYYYKRNKTIDIKG